MQHEPTRATGGTRRAPRAAPFVGRESELAAIAARLDEGSRLVTLVGPGGIGKTALAVELALRRQAAGLRASVVWCDLSSVTDAAGIVDAVALACAVESRSSEDALARIASALADHGEVLVVLDNFDMLVPHALDTVGAWLAAAPEAELLVTSRSRLGLLGEVVVEVGPLPTTGAPTSEGAVALLVAAARRSAAEFVLRAEDGASAAEIASMLEGVPLALEMAGARLPLLGARGLLDHLRASSESLRRESRGGPARHTSLDEAVRGSFASLGKRERDVLVQLSVFRGGFTLRSAEGVVALESTRPGEASLLTVLDTLRARSLVRTRDAGAARFDLYASVRSFVQREQPGPLLAATSRHAAWFLAEAERAAAEAHRDAEARAWLTVERENVLAVVERVLPGGPVTAQLAEPALRALVALSSVLLTRGPQTLLAALITPVVERTRDSGADPRLSARAMLLRGATRRERGDVRAALKDLLGAESIARAVDDALLGADVRVELGRTVLSAGEVEAAREHFEKAAVAFADLGARGHEAHATAWLALGSVLAGRALASARALAERAAALVAAGEVGRASYLVVLGRIVAELGDTATARRVLEEAAAAAERDADALVEARARMLLGLVLHDRGEVGPAGEQLAAARDRFSLHGLDVDAAIARGHLGALARESASVPEAYALLADARDVAVRGGREEDVTYLERHLAAIDAELGREARAVERARPTMASRELSALAVSAWKLDVGDAGATWLHLRLLERVRGREPAALFPDDALVVGKEGAWFRAPQVTGEPSVARVGLERRRSLGLLLDRLATERVARPGGALTPSALFAAAWPGERALASAAAHRVRVAIATLRKMGLRDAIVTQPDGYSLAVSCLVVRA